MTNTTQAPRPAAVDTEAAWQAVRAMRLAASIAGTDAERADLREWADAHLALAADLDAARAERDAARAALPRCEEDLTEAWLDRDAALRALEPFGAFAAAWEAMPLRGVDDVFYAIHTGTEWEAELTLTDCRAARAVLDTQRAAIAARAARAAAAADPVTVPDLPAFLAARVNGAVA